MSTQYDSSENYISDNALVGDDGIIEPELTEDGVFTEVLQSLAFGEGLEGTGSRLGNGNSGYEPESRTYGFSYNETADYKKCTIVQNAVEVIPQVALDTFEYWKEGEDEDSEDTKSDKKTLKRLRRWFDRKIYLELLQGCFLGRLTGEGFIVVVTDDDPSPATPFRVDKECRFVSIFAVPRWQMTRPDYAVGEKYYRLSYVDDYYEDLQGVWEPINNELLIHPSRVISLPGKIVHKSLSQARYYSAHQSVLDTLIPALRGWIKSNVSAIQMLETHSAFTLGIANLAVKAKRKDKAGIKNRLQATALSMRTAKGLLYDKNTEDASMVNRTYSGVDNIVTTLNSYLDSSSDTPFEFLIYGAKAFESGTSGARQALAQRVHAYDKTHLRPALERLAFMYLSTMGNSDYIDDIDPVFGDGMILTAEEKELSTFKKAQRDVLLVNGQIIRNDNPRLMREWGESNPYTPEELEAQNNPQGGDQGGRNSMANAANSKQGRENDNGADVNKG